MSTLSRNALGQYKVSLHFLNCSRCSSSDYNTETRYHYRITQANPDLLHLAFNQDSSCISIGTRKGYSIHNVEPFGRVYSRGTDRPCVFGPQPGIR